MGQVRKAYRDTSMKSGGVIAWRFAVFGPFYIRFAILSSLYMRPAISALVKCECDLQFGLCDIRFGAFLLHTTVKCYKYERECAVTA